MMGWREKTIEEVCEVVNGGTPKTGVKDYWGGLHQWVTPAEMGKRPTPYIDKTERTLTDAGIANSSARSLPVKSVILSSRAPIGHLVINEAPMSFNQGCKGLVPKSGLHYKFLYYFLFANVDLLNSLGTGATFKELSGGKLKGVRIPLPLLPEQKRIVEILDEAFYGIAKATANAERNLQNAQDLFDSFLADFFSRKESGWRDVHLKSVCDKITVGHVGSMAKRYVPSGIPFLRSQNIRPFMLDLDNVIFIDQKFHSELKKSSLVAGDVAIVRTGYPGTAAVIPNDLGPANCSDIVIVRPNDTVLPDFLAAFFNSSFGKASVGGRLVGAAQKHFNVSAAKETIIHLPPLEVQKKFTKTVGEFKKEVACLEDNCSRKKALLEELKQSLLHKAFTGQLTSSNVVQMPRKLVSPMEANAKLTAEIIILAHYRHAVEQKNRTFGHVKAQKTLHLAEVYAKIPLGRAPIKDAAGPNDFAHMLRAEEWAERNGFFKFNKRDKGYSFQKLRNYDQLLKEAIEKLKPYQKELDKILQLLIPMNTQEAQVFTTVHTAWNNLIVDRKHITDDEIVKEARDNWHADKLKISRGEFLKAIRLIKKEGLIPDGSAKAVRTRQERLL